MSKYLITGIEYALPDTFHRLIGRLESFLDEGDSTEFLDFETDLARMNINRNSFSEVEREAISKTLEKIPYGISSGGYLDYLEKIVVEVNNFLAQGRGKMESGYSGNVYSEDTMAGEFDLWDAAVEVREERYQEFRDYLSSGFSIK